MEKTNQNKPPETGGRENKHSQRQQWKTIYEIVHFKGGDKKTVPKTVQILEDDEGTIYLSVRDENNKVIVRLDDEEVAQIIFVLQGRLLRKAMMK